MFAHKAWEKLKLQAPADVMKVAERLGIEVHEREFEEEIDGVYIRIPGAPPVIAVNCCYLKPEGRKRFTLAHEIGHHLLSRGAKADSRFCIFDAANTRRTMMERACDRFAAHLLMPEELVRQFYTDLVHNARQRIPIMAERFGVSTWALRRRLRELGMPIRERRRV
jgi:Zn-dependent peptidase ImmA (M78 family)